MSEEPGQDAAATPTLPLSAEEALAAAREILPWMIEVRRDFHQHPELGLEEHRTAKRIDELLDELGIPHVSGLAGTGVLGIIHGEKPGPVVALRADIDALPLQDAKDVPYKSRIPGKMHACGHDVHTAILLGASRLLQQRASELTGTVKLIFQPAEETVGGARLLIEEGVLDDPKVDAIFGLHVDAEREAGFFRLHYGQRNASSDDVHLVVHGRSGHGAYPSGGVDAIVVAAQVVTGIQTVISRSVDARESAVITFGTIHGGVAPNVLAERVELVGTVRSLDQPTRERVLRRLQETADGIARGLGGSAEVTIEPSYDPLINNDSMVDVVRANAKDLVGEDHIEIMAKPNMGVEDFGYYLSHVPGAFYAIGVRNEERGIVHPEHHNLFDVDEECMAYGAAAQVLNALSILSEC